MNQMYSNRGNPGLSGASAVDRDDADRVVVLGVDPDFLVCQGVCLTHRRRRHHQSGVVVVDGLHREPGPAGTAHTPWSDNLGVGVQWSETCNATDFEQDLIRPRCGGRIATL
jgi:hypothetical protein